MTTQDIALATTAMIGWVALIHLMMASGVRLGELVWSGRQPRLLPPALRRRSLFYAIGLIASSVILAFATGLVASPIPARWSQSATFAASAFLGVSLVYCVFAGSRWERMLFAPIMLMGTLIGAWLTLS